MTPSPSAGRDLSHSSSAERWNHRARAVRVGTPMPAASNKGSRRRLPFGPLASMWTVWLLASSWAPFVGLVMALADLRLERRTFLETLAANWGIGALFLIRLRIAYVAV